MFGDAHALQKRRAVAGTAAESDGSRSWSDARS